MLKKLLVSRCYATISIYCHMLQSYKIAGFMLLCCLSLDADVCSKIAIPLSAFKGLYYNGGVAFNGQHNNGWYNNGAYYNNYYQSGYFYDGGKKHHGKHHKHHYNHGEFNNGVYFVNNSPYTGVYGGMNYRNGLCWNNNNYYSGVWSGAARYNGAYVGTPHTGLHNNAW